jgi:hypothetical protein
LPGKRFKTRSWSERKKEKTQLEKKTNARFARARP